MAGELGGMCKKAASERVSAHFATPCHKNQAAHKRGETPRQVRSLCMTVRSDKRRVVGYPLGKKLNPNMGTATIGQRWAAPSTLFTQHCARDRSRADLPLLPPGSCASRFMIINHKEYRTPGATAKQAAPKCHKVYSKLKRLFVQLIS